MEALIENNNQKWCNAFFWPPLGSVSVIRGCAKSDLPTGLVLGSGPTAPGLWRTSELRGLLEITGCLGGKPPPRPLGGFLLSRAWMGGGSQQPLFFMSTCDISRSLCVSISSYCYTCLCTFLAMGKKLKYMKNICFLQILCLEIAVEFVASYRNNHFKNVTANYFF